MNLIKSILIVVVIVSGAYSGNHLDTVYLTLEQLLLNTFNSNPLIRIEQLNTDIASAVYRESFYVYEPRIQASVQSVNRSDMSGDENRTLEASLQITEELPTGTKIQLGGNVTPATSMQQGQTTENQYRNTYGLTVTQAILRGFNPFVNLAPLRKAGLDINIRQQELAGYAQRLLYDTEKAYWDLYLSAQELDIHRHSLALAKRLMHESEERLKAGRIAALDLASIRAEVASRERNLIDAETAHLRKQYRLVYLMNRPELWSSFIVATDTLLLPGSVDSLDDHISVSKVYRPDLRLARFMLNKGELDLIQTRNGLLPRLDFFISLQGYSYQESFSDALGSFSHSSGSVSGGLTLNFPLTSGAARERYRRARFSREQTCQSLTNLVRLIEYEVRSAYLEVSRAQKQIDAAVASRTLQEEKLEAEQAKLMAGKSTEYLLLQAQRDLTLAKLDEARARISHVMAVLDLYMKDGTLLERRGVDSKT
ncbi:outer membrane efflux protein [Chitinispirillum alkaliphilum]|nr:outer membrane efflux protein [Chitinispirillum alkaliphilum]